jgi:hypothetical protein
MLAERTIFAQLPAAPGSSLVDGSPRSRTEIGERAARRSLRLQIAKLEREFADAFVTAYPMGGIELPEGPPGEPRLLDLLELEQVRDDLAERVRRARLTITERGDRESASRLLLEQMLLEPAKYRFCRVARRDLGEPRCGYWHVMPRLGPIGMLMGWWQVTLSSGCPLAGGRGLVPRPVSRHGEPPTDADRGYGGRGVRRHRRLAGGVAFSGREACPACSAVDLPGR